MYERAVTVRQLNLYVKSLLEGDGLLADVAVTGELSNFKIHYASGHWYFTLKDAAAAVRCVMFRASAARVRFQARDGMLVTVRGRVSVYERDGQYQLYAEEMYEAGEGELAAEFERTKKRLEDEGLFAAESKRPLPPFPSRIAVVTSDTGAAVRDILNILERRYPSCAVVVCPVAVQGEQAVSDMLGALGRVYALSGIDLIIIGRGGGSAEDLRAFNSEALARRIYESPVPVISAVGHETDFTICDFVADLRAPTPSAAAELAVPDRRELLAVLNRRTDALSRSLRGKYELSSARLSALMSSPVLRHPADISEVRRQRLDRVLERLSSAASAAVDKREYALHGLVSGLDALSPLKTLSRGFAVAEMNGKAVRQASELNVGDSLRLRFHEGGAVCAVTERND